METYVVKKDGSREPFDRDKLKKGVLLALRKRPVSVTVVDDFLDRLEAGFQEKGVREIPARELGAAALGWLKDVDQVAYVRFASVYRDFRGVKEFMDELQRLAGPPA